MKASTLQSAAALLALLCPACGKPPDTAPYGEKVRYREGQAIAFADFTLTFKGQRRVVPPQYPRGWLAYDFIIRAGSGEQTITWSAGTGLIDATDFTVNGRNFALERVMAKHIGKLRDDELVVSPIKR